MKYYFLAAALCLCACDVKVSNPPADSNTTIVNPPAQKTEEKNTTIIAPPAEKKTETTTTVGPGSTTQKTTTETK